MIDRVLTDLQGTGLVRNRAGSGNGGRVVVDGVSRRNFGSCSYLGLETDLRLVAGARAALDEYGTQFSFSRAYLELPLYHRLEAALGQVTERHVIVAASTTLAHLAALPVLIDDD